MQFVRKRLTYANVMSSIAVFLVVGGATAFAATQLGKRNRRHQAAEEKRSDPGQTQATGRRKPLTGATGPAGPQGAKGDRGEKGATGEPGPFPSTAAEREDRSTARSRCRTATAASQAFGGDVSDTIGYQGRRRSHVKEGHDQHDLHGKLRKPDRAARLHLSVRAIVRERRQHPRPQLRQQNLGLRPLRASLAAGTVRFRTWAAPPNELAARRPFVVAPLRPSGGVPRLKRRPAHFGLLGRLDQWFTSRRVRRDL